MRFNFQCTKKTGVMMQGEHPIHHSACHIV